MAHNPYSPPSAELADLAGGSLPAQPWQVKAAIASLFLSLVITLLGFLLDGKSLGYEPGASRASYILLSTGYLIMFGLVGLVVFYLVRGYRWARIVFSVLIGVSLVNEVRYLPAALDLQRHSFVIYLLNMSMESAFVILLFTPAANRWFRAAKLARSKA